MYELQRGIPCLSCPQKDESIQRLASELAAAQVERDRLQALAPRLEWLNGYLHLCIDLHTQCLFHVERNQSGSFNLYDVNASGDDVMGYGLSTDRVNACLAEWHAATLPSLHLPPFPGASDAS